MNAHKIGWTGAAAITGALLINPTAAPASPQWINDPVTITGHRDVYMRVVSYRDLSLNTDAGRKILVHRVGVAVSQVCPSYDAIFHDYDADGCRVFAWHGARPQLNSAFAAAKSGLPLAMSIEVSGAGR